MTTHASQGKWTAIQASTCVMKSPSSDKDKLSHMDAWETGDSPDHESVVDLLGGLLHVILQTAEDIISPLPLLTTTRNSAIWEQEPGCGRRAVWTAPMTDAAAMLKDKPNPPFAPGLFQQGEDNG
ncbi:hypothetical protein NDU88_002660 [Pleurodeles waltl]|uniref:Uncharacterized protein n=1 Tax=Pleurodeles waltl TaxID=8319 RepID=A0AAV7T2Z5_PLEWA|nr:hypothetical protein NDU88_002660 [Pleurodeles waltl]